MAIFFNFFSILNHLLPLQDENCDSNLRLVVDEDDYGKFRLERIEPEKLITVCFSRLADISILSRVFNP